MIKFSEYMKCARWAYDQVERRLAELRYVNPPVYIRPIKLNPTQGWLDTGPAQETEYPYREGTALVLRLFRDHGLTAGILDSHPDMDDDEIDKRLLRAIQSAEGPPEFQEESGKSWAEWARRAVAEHSLDLEEEARLTEMLGLWEENH